MKKKLFRTHAFITGIVLIGFICITIINYCTYSVVIRDDIRNISRLTSLNIFSSISNELTKLRSQLLDFTSLIELELDFSEEDVIHRNKLRNCKTTSTA